MKFYVTKKQHLTTNRWTGGTATELAIYPVNASYEEQKFQFRLSTANVEVEESDFTQLPGVERTLMVLDGELKLDHEGHHSKTLKKFETDKFSGDWKTKSQGKAIDFNLMTTGNTKGELDVLKLKEGIIIKTALFTDHNTELYYAHKGVYTIKIDRKEVIIGEGDVILFLKDSQEEDITLEPLTDCEIIVSKLAL